MVSVNDQLALALFVGARKSSIVILRGGIDVAIGYIGFGYIGLCTAVLVFSVVNSPTL